MATRLGQRCQLPQVLRLLCVWVRATDLHFGSYIPVASSSSNWFRYEKDQIAPHAVTPAFSLKASRL